MREEGCRTHRGSADGWLAAYRSGEHSGLPGPRVRRNAGTFQRLLALALVVLLVPLPRAEAYPISPVTLWELTQEAELVVWADVEAVVSAPWPESDTGGGLDLDADDVARLRVREVWKGEAGVGERVEVYFSSGVICPAPPSYEPGLAVVAFLAKEDGKWKTVALSYGTRYPTSEDEAEAYRQAVKRVGVALEQMKVAQAAGKEEIVQRAITDWKVLAASHPATRWDGLYGLVPDADEDHYFFDQREIRPVFLSRQQREQLARGFVVHPPLDGSLPMMLVALRGHASKEVDRVAANALETVLAGEKPPYWAALAFDLLRQRHGEKLQKRPRSYEDPLLRAGRDKLGGPGASKPPTGHPLVQEWRRFKARHHLEPKRLPLPVESPVLGTGGETPP